MKKAKLLFLFVSLSFFGAFGQNGNTQAKKEKELVHQEHDFQDYLKDFNLDSANQVFNQMGLPETERSGIIRVMKRKYLMNNYPHLYQKKKNPKGDDLIPMKSGNCPNAGFENLTFNPEWTGGLSTYNNAYTNSTIMSNGINAAYNDPNARHTILTASPVNNNPLFGAIVGYDPLAINPNTGIADIPLVAPGGNGVSVRIGNDNANEETTRARYVINVTPDNKSFFYLFAIILENPGHIPTEQPYFKITLFDTSGTQVAGPCGEYMINATNVSGDSSFFYSPGSQIYYRKWRRVDVDLTPFLGQQITAEFEIASCALGGHFGYAYIDAGCQKSLDTKVNYCVGDPSAQLVAPAGFNSYQWFGPNSTTTPIAGATNDTLVVLLPNLNDTFYVQFTAASGCQLFQQVVLQYSTIQIDEVNTTGACFGSNNGKVEVKASGSSQGYIYNFQPINQQNNTGKLNNLFAGSYTVTVSSPNPSCGNEDTSFIIDNPPIYPSSISAPFCEGVGTIEAPQSNSYKWYDNSQTVIPAPVGTSQTIIDSSAFEGKKYYLKYQLANGCFDSLIYTFYDNRAESFAIISSPAGCRSVNIAFNDDTPATDTLTFSINGPNGYSVVWYDTAFVDFEANGLDTGEYFVRFIDEGCNYDTSFIITDLVVTDMFSFIFCESDQFNLSSQYNGTHQWTDPLGVVIGTGPSVIISDIIEGSYIDSCEVSPGCYSLTIYSMDSITIKTEYNVIDNVCYGGSEGEITIQMVNGPPGPIVYYTVGPDGYTSTNDTLTELEEGTYIVKTSVLACEHYDTIYVDEPPLPADTLFIYAELCEELTETTIYAPTGYTEYQWFFNGDTLAGQTGDALVIPYPTVVENYSVTYSVPPLGCTKRTLKYNKVPFEFKFEPSKLNNVITPNVDMINGFYHPFHDENWTPEEISYIARSYRLTIYNRWGGKVWETESYKEGWNGKTKNGEDVSDGVYFAEIQYSQKCESQDYMYKAVQQITVIR